MSGITGPGSLTPSSVSPNPESLADSSGESNSGATQRLMGSFQDVLTDKLRQVEDYQRNAHQKMKQFAAGEIDNVHDVSIALQKANMSVRLATLFRQKILSGYNELKQLQ
jgi:flagellar hook-basal body complex protein FliE